MVRAVEFGSGVGRHPQGEVKLCLPQFGVSERSSQSRQGRASSASSRAP